MYVLSSGGQRSEAEKTRHEQKHRQKETHTSVRSRTAVAHNIRDQAYPTMKASITQRQRSRWLEDRYRSVWLSVSAILSVYSTRLGVGFSNRGVPVYSSSTQYYYSSTAAEHVFIHDIRYQVFVV